MANDPPSSAKTKPSGPAASMRITTSNSPSLKPSVRSPQKPIYQSNLSLHGVIGTTVTTPNGLSVHGPSRSFALCAGSTVVLSELDNSNNINQRFLRARPSATSFYPITSFYNQSSSPIAISPTARRRSLSVPKSNTNGNGNIFNSSPGMDSADGAGSRHLSSKEKIKAVTCVSISPNGRLVAFGEVRTKCFFFFFFFFFC